LKPLLKVEIVVIACFFLVQPSYAKKDKIEKAFAEIEELHEIGNYNNSNF
jgi:hypothetical protein